MATEVQDAFAGVVQVIVVESLLDVNDREFEVIFQPLGEF